VIKKKMRLLAHSLFPPFNSAPHQILNKDFHAAQQAQGQFHAARNARFFA
jgi:hypothetical protein